MPALILAPTATTAHYVPSSFAPSSTGVTARISAVPSGQDLLSTSILSPDTSGSPNPTTTISQSVYPDGRSLDPWPARDVTSEVANDIEKRTQQTQSTIQKRGLSTRNIVWTAAGSVALLTVTGSVLYIYRRKLKKKLKKLESCLGFRREHPASVGDIARSVNEQGDEEQGFGLGSLGPRDTTLAPQNSTQSSRWGFVPKWPSVRGSQVDP